MKIEDRVIQTIVQSKGMVLLRADFKDCGASASQVSRILKKLVEKGLIQRISKGAFVKTKVNKFTGDRTPAAPLEVVAKELFARLGIEVSAPAAVEEYNAGRTTQVPAGGVVVTKGRRISRKITVAGRMVRYS